MELLLQQMMNALALGATYLLIALGLFLIYTVLDIPNFAHGELLTFGAYSQYLFAVQLGIPFLIALVLSCVASGLIGLGLYLGVFGWLRKAPLITVLIASLALSITLQQVIGLIWGTAPLTVPTPIADVLHIGPTSIPTYLAVVFVVALVVAASLAWLVYRSGYGKKLRSLAQNRTLAELAGVPVRRITIITFVIGSVLGGLAGAMLSAAQPMNPYMGTHPVLVSFVILILIGAGGRLRAVVAVSFVFAIAETLTAGYIANALRESVVIFVLLIFLAIKPEGVIRNASTERARL